MNPELLEQLSELDAAGFIIRENEGAEEFLQRVNEVREVNERFETELAEKGSVKVFDTFEVNAEDRISPELSGEAAAITENLYGFAVTHVPGFYLTKQIGWLWGGCLIGDPEENFAVFLLRDAFRNKRRFLNYRREELLAHELCHSVRHVLEEPTLEEYFAYQTSPSALRRYLGNCFISDRDAWGFLLPVMLLPIAEVLRALWNPQFPSWVFWVMAVIYPLFLLLRNAVSRKLVDYARKTLRAAGVEKSEAVLFRCTPDELDELAELKPENFASWIEEKAAQQVRWQVIKHRFFDKMQEDNEL